MSKTKQKIAACIALLSLVLPAGNGALAENTNSNLENGLEAIQDAMNRMNGQAALPETIDDLREGSSEDTVPTPDDFPAAYNYGLGTIRDYSRTRMLAKMPQPDGNATVLNTAADPTRIQALYLWEEGSAPAKTSFTPDMTGYFDDWDFRPYVTAIPVREGVQPKGAVVLMAGGAYQFRGNYTDSLPTAALRELGFQTFIVDYRLSPYTQEEGALDVARAAIAANQTQADSRHVDIRLSVNGQSVPTKVEEPADGEGSLEESGSPATNGPMIKADKEAMQTAVKNLVENAIHYSPEHTTVAVGVGERDGKVTIRVVDQGIGIPAKSLDRIFERFYRVDPARSRETGGSGLGLAITKHCVQENGGRISVWSRTGEGSTFTIELPAAPDEEDDEARSDESTQA